MIPEILNVSKKVVCFSIFFFLCVSGIVLPQGKGNGVEVRTTSPKLQDTKPGRIITLSFRITNFSGEEQEFRESLNLPDGWQAIVPISSFILRNGESNIRLVAVFIPENALAGRYEISYSVQAIQNYGIQDGDTVSVVVLPISKIALLVEEKAESVIAGELLQSKLRLVNQGNTELKVSLEVKSYENYPAKLEPADVLLPAGKSALILLSVQTDPKEIKHRTLVIEVKASVLKEKEKKKKEKEEVATASTTIAVEIIPRISGELDIYHRLSVDLTFRISGEEGNLNSQFAVQGKGTLDEKGEKKVDFFFQAPRVDDSGPFSELDEYRLNYSDRNFGVRIGDQSYDLSRLTSAWSYGRGVGLEYHPLQNPIILGGHYLQSRWEEPEKKEQGFYVGYQVNDKLLTRVNFLRKDKDAYDIFRSIRDDIWSFETEYKPREELNLEMEYAQSNSDNRKEGNIEDDAYYIDMSGRLWQKSYYDFNVIHAGPDYYGYYHDSEYIYSNFSFPMGEWTQGYVSYRQWETNLDRRIDRNSASLEQQWEIGVNQDIGKNWYVSLSYDDLSREDKLFPVDYKYEEDGITAGIGKRGNKYNLRFDIRTADQKNCLTGDSRRGWNYGLFATYKPTEKNYFTLHVGFGDDDVLQGSYLLRESNNLEFMASFKPIQDLNLDFWYTKYNFNGSNDNPESDSYNCSINYKLPNKHRIGLRVRHNTGEWREDETSYMLTYTIPLGIPISKKKSVGSIKGIVYDGESPDKKGISGVILHVNGSTAVTNSKGEYIFPSAVPGTYQIYVDRTSIGLDKITEEKLPITVEVKGGESSNVDIGVVRSCNVSGKVVVIPGNGNGNGNGNNGNGHNGNSAVIVGEPGGNGKKEPAPLQNILIELTNGQDVLRRTTDQKGEFLFDNVRPGTWHLKIYDHNLPSYHYIETPEQDITLQPGESKEINVKVLPKVRQIKFIDEGTIKSDSHK